MKQFKILVGNYNLRINKFRENSRFSPYLQNHYIRKQYYFNCKMKDSKLTSSVVGIDIGAFSAKIAGVQRGTIDIITNKANFRQTPAIVGFGQGERKLGQIGNIKLKSNFKNTILSPTRYLGLDISESSAKLQTNYSPCLTKIQGENLYFKVNYNGKDEKFTPEQILACFLTQLSSIIQYNNIDEKLIVFSVPSYFTQIQKKAFQNAAQIAGLRNIKFVSQAVAIGLDFGSFKKAQMANGKNVVFIDFGHSKLSVSLLKFTETNMEVVLQKYNRNLGCRNIDQKVFNYMASKFEEKKSLNLRQSKRASLKLLQAIHKQRKILTGISETDITIECLFQDEDFSEVFTRQIMEKSSAQVFEQIKNTLINFKQEINSFNIKIDILQLVGGGSRIPKFIQVVQKIFKMNASRTINSSQTIARGATLAAVQYSGLFRFPNFVIVNRSALSLVLTWIQVKSKKSNEKVKVQYFSPKNIKNILQASQHLPAQKQIKIHTNRKIEAFISYDILDNQIEKKVGQLFIQKPIQNKNEINLLFEINQNGYITLKSVKDNDGNAIHFSIKYFKQLTKDQIISYKAKQRQMFVRDFSIIKSQQKRNQLQSFIYKQKEILQKHEIKKYSTSQQILNIHKYLNTITQSLESQQKMMNIKDYDKKMKEVQKQIKNLEQIIKKRHHQIQNHFKQLQKLKNHARDTIKNITQKYRSSKPVAQTCEEMKKIQNWTEEIIRQSKKKSFKELPLVSNQDIEQQYQNIKQLANQLLNPPKKTVQQPRHQHFEQHYDPQERYKQQKRYQPRRSYQNQQYQNYGEQYPPRNLYQTQYYPHQRYQYYQPKASQYQFQPQQQRKKPQQQYDPFGMTRSGYFGPSSNKFGDISGFW